MELKSPLHKNLQILLHGTAEANFRATDFLTTFFENVFNETDIKPENYFENSPTINISLSFLNSSEVYILSVMTSLIESSVFSINSANLAALVSYTSLIKA